MARNQVFISYSHKDPERWLADLRTHLQPYTREGSVTAWSDEHIAPGSKWFDEIKSALAKAKVAVLLVTPNFLASEFIHEHELCPLLKRVEEDGMKILWIPVRACSYEKSAIAKYQAVIEPKKPLAEMRAERDRAWVRICEAIANAADKRPRPRNPPSASSVAHRNQPKLKIVRRGRQTSARNRLLRELTQASATGKLRESPICKIVIRVLRGEPDVEVEPNYDWDRLVTGIQFSDEDGVRVMESVGLKDWQLYWPHAATPALVAVAKSLKRSPKSQRLVIRLCKKIADSFELDVVWPRRTDRFDEAANAIYKACLEATELKSEEVLMALRALKISVKKR
jgi:hypothetical protein